MTERLPPRLWMAASSTRAVIAALEAAGGTGCARFVGGCVRDALLGVERPWNHHALDIDLATTLEPPAVVAALEAAGLRAVPTGIAHGTITAVAEGRPFEITTLRRDVETDGRHAVVAFTDDWAQDAARRDFRLNALYADPDGTLHDPTGEGVADARAGRVVFVGDPDARIAEDYLRILRFFRFFAGYGRGAADAAALKACARLRGGIARLSGERIAAELLKLLAVADPRPAMRLMAETGVLDEVAPQTNGAATLSRFDGLVNVERTLGDPPDPLLRLAALLPSVGVDALARRLRLSNARRDRLLASVRSSAGLHSGLSAVAARALVYGIGRQAFTDRAKLAWASTGGDAAAWRAVLAAADWTPPPFPVTGEEIKAAGVPEGPMVGRVRQEIEARWIAADFPADPDFARELLRLAVASLAAEPGWTSPPRPVS